MLEPIMSPALTALAGVAHGFFTRRGGVSDGVYGSLNCGLGSGDARPDVIENRNRVATHFGLTGQPLLTCFQVHSANVVVVAAPWGADAQPKADALVTRTPGLVLGTLAADCTPILLADSRARVIAAAHAGWKGALGGIIEATVAAMEREGARRSDIVAAVGPCISQNAYEVGPDFEAAFLAKDPGYAVYFRSEQLGGRPFFDLPGFVLDRLRRAELGHVENVTQCTYAHADRFFSYRRMTHAGEVDYGRQISALVLA